MTTYCQNITIKVYDDDGPVHNGNIIIAFPMKEPFIISNKATVIQKPLSLILESNYIIFYNDNHQIFIDETESLITDNGTKLVIPVHKNLIINPKKPYIDTKIQ